MSWIDWLVLVGSMIGIIGYGLYKSRGNQDMRSYFSADSNIKWYTIGLSIMATQASAITFLSAPGQAFTDGMRFLQFYFGLPLALVFISAFILPIYRQLKILTAYEYLGNRFNNQTRVMATFIFLLQRSLGAGFTIFAPALVLSSVLGWNIYMTNVLIGVIVISYTVMGGTKAVNYTHKLQMLIILGGMLLAGILVISQLPEGIGVDGALRIAGRMHKLNILDFNFSLENGYNIWAGIIGGFFLQLSYFATDQSQVQRYLGQQSLNQSRLGLMFNAVLKIPMQFMILLIGIFVFVFYQFYQPPIYFKKNQVEKVYQSTDAHAFTTLESEYNKVNSTKASEVRFLADPELSGSELAQHQKTVNDLEESSKAIKNEAVALLQKHETTAEKNDVNYIFIGFVLDYFPQGIIGLLLACILFASMSSTSSELNALASTTMVDIYKNLFNKNGSERHYLLMSKVFTAGWGVYAILFAMLAGKLGSLIEAVNRVGSVFYGPILGIFIVGFFVKYIRGKAVIISAIVAQSTIAVLFFSEYFKIHYLWNSLIGCGIVVILGLVVQKVINSNLPSKS